jgi:hypothetical protein
LEIGKIQPLFFYIQIPHFDCGCFSKKLRLCPTLEGFRGPVNLKTFKKVGEIEVLFVNIPSPLVPPSVGGAPKFVTYLFCYAVAISLIG